MYLQPREGGKLQKKGYEMSTQRSSPSREEEGGGGEKCVLQKKSKQG